MFHGAEGKSYFHSNVKMFKNTYLVRLAPGWRHSFFETLNNKGFSLFFANSPKTAIILKCLPKMMHPWACTGQGIIKTRKMV
jgi:hypothetical protein